MGRDEVGNQVEGQPPPNGAEDVAGEVLRPAQEAQGVVDLGEVLDEERDQERRHHPRRRSPPYQRRRRHPQHDLHGFKYDLVT